MYNYATTKQGNEIVATDMELIKSSGVGGSLLLFGSFGRGEGLVLNGTPRNDYDLLLIDGTEADRNKILGIKLAGKPEVHPVSSTDIRDVSCTQQWFEIKYASQTLIGDTPSFPEWEPYDIPFVDAITSLERRSVSMLIAKWEMGKEKPDERKIIEQIVKGIVALGDAVLIKRGQFHPKYSVRALMLSQDDIGGLYGLAISSKLLGHPDWTRDMQWELWHKTRQLMRQYAIDNQLRLEIGELLFAVNDMTPREDLEQLITKLGGGDWL